MGSTPIGQVLELIDSTSLRCTVPDHVQANCQHVPMSGIAVVLLSAEFAGGDTYTVKGDYVAQIIPPAPTLPAGSCWTYIKRCPLQSGYRTNEWVRDGWGEQNLNTGKDRSVCVNTRPTQFDNWCGIRSDEITMHFIPPPVEPPTPPVPTSPAGSCWTYI